MDMTSSTRETGDDDDMRENRAEDDLQSPSAKTGTPKTQDFMTRYKELEAQLSTTEQKIADLNTMIQARDQKITERDDKIKVLEEKLSVVTTEKEQGISTRDMEISTLKAKAEEAQKEFNEKIENALEAIDEGRE
jgi:uncharacterized coiled-coil protein SlyX